MGGPGINILVLMPSFTGIRSFIEGIIIIEGEFNRYISLQMLPDDVALL
jgi:hypothetical protein